mgnify:CR=1 FL=1
MGYSIKSSFVDFLKTLSQVHCKIFQNLYFDKNNQTMKFIDTTCFF